MAATVSFGRGKRLIFRSVLCYRLPPWQTPEAPKFKTYAEGELIPSVDPEDIKSTWEDDPTNSKVGANGWNWLLNRQAVGSPEA